MFHEANNAVGRELWHHQTSETVSSYVSYRPEVPVLVNSVAFVDIPPELLAVNPEMGHMRPGLAHGSQYVSDCVEGWFQHVDVRENRPRFALLSVLYGWMVAAERQFFYGTRAPYLVYSFDHDAFFPGGPDWTINGLESAPFADVDAVIVEQCGLRHGELNAACAYLEKIDPEIIASAIRTTPGDWGGVTIDERVSLAEYLWDRCESMK